jgi:hypothetical protein
MTYPHVRIQNVEQDQRLFENLIHLNKILTKRKKKSEFLIRFVLLIEDNDDLKYPMDDFFHQLIFREIVEEYGEAHHHH